MKFWNREYRRPTHLALSTEPADDLEKFTRWLERRYGRSVLNQNAQILDLGCGNGRNLIYLAKEFHCRGLGLDSSSEAIKQAKGLAVNLPLEFVIGSLKNSLPKPDQSVTLVLDMMSSHILRLGEREKLRDEIARVLRPGGWLFFKSFLLEDDAHAKRLLREYPAPPEAGQAAEPHAYLHPELKQYEHVWTIAELEDFFSSQFTIHKIEKSHKHRSHGHAFRRRTLTAYLEKKD